MFRVTENVPDIYVEESRDFQLLARLYDLAFHCSRFSIDSMKYISDAHYCNESILPLLSSKVGFFNDKDLEDRYHRFIVCAFPYIIKNKGSAKSVQQVTNLFSRLVNASFVVTLGNNDITITFESYAPDVVLLREVLSYVKPAGMTLKFELITPIPESASTYAYEDKIKVHTYTTRKHNSNVTTSAKGSFRVPDLRDANSVGFTLSSPAPKFIGKPITSEEKI